MGAKELASLYEDLHRSLQDRSPSESNALIDDILRAERALPEANVLDSRARAHLHLLKLHNHYRAGELAAARAEARLAMVLAPYDENISRLYGGLLDERPAGPPRPLLLVVSCAKYLARARALAERLRPIPGFALRIVVSRQARIPADPVLLAVDAADDYEALPHKVRDAFVQVFETYAGGTSVFKIDDDLRIRSLRRFAKSLQSIAEGAHDYVGWPVHSRHHDRTWHFKKCTDPAIDQRLYGKRFHAPFASGPFYFLSARALEAFALATLRFPHEIAGELYEDKFVGDTLWNEGIALHTVEFPRIGLAPLFAAPTWPRQ
jgi:hypothetical protein